MNSYEQPNRPIILWLFLLIFIVMLGVAGLYMFMSADEPQVSQDGQNTVQQQMIIDQLSQLGERFDQLEQQHSFNSATDVPSRSSTGDDALIRLTELADDLSDLSARLEKLESGQDNLLTGGAGKGSESTSFAGRLHMTEDEMLEQKMQHEQDIAHLESKLAMEEVDPDLGPRMDSVLEEVLASRAGWSEQVRALTKCGGTMCRFEIEIPASMNATDRFELENSFMIGMGMIMPSGSMIRYINNPDGSQTLVGFLGKTSGDLTRKYQ